MATSDQEQMSEMVRMKARLAMGAKLDGTSLQSKGSQGQKSSSNTRGNASSGALARVKSK
ncbi:MAG: hypothetical protein RL756_2072 [Pseudomonadota bacterium]|jgi:hypothetical protein